MHHTHVVSTARTYGEYKCDLRYLIYLTYYDHKSLPYNHNWIDLVRIVTTKIISNKFSQKNGMVPCLQIASISYCTSSQCTKSLKKKRKKKKKKKKKTAWFIICRTHSREYFLLLVINSI